MPSGQATYRTHGAATRRSPSQSTSRAATLPTTLPTPYRSVMAMAVTRPWLAQSRGMSEGVKEERNPTSAHRMPVREEGSR